MSTVAVPGEISNRTATIEVLPEFAGRQRSPANAVRRRTNQQQGRALEVIGHAIEYLVDSRLFIISGLDDRAEHEAVQILMRASRAVFADCVEVVPLRRQFGLWVEKRLPWSV